MELRVSRRVHIMPVGYEYDRILQPAQEYRADLVVLLGHRNNDKKGERCLQDVVEGLTNENIEYRKRRCDIFDLYDSLATMTEVIANHADDDVYVNVSSGSKITAIAGMIASMVMDSRAYYAKAKEYGGIPDDAQDLDDLDDNLFTPEGVDKATELPRYPIDAPDRDQVSVMEFINKWSQRHGPPTKGEIIYFSNHAGLSFIKGDVADKGEYRLLDANILDPLSNRDWVKITKQGRNKVVSLSENGEAALSAFRWMDRNGKDVDEVIKKIEDNQSR